MWKCLRLVVCYLGHSVTFFLSNGALGSTATGHKCDCDWLVTDPKTIVHCLARPRSSWRYMEKSNCHPFHHNINRSVHLAKKQKKTEKPKLFYLLAILLTLIRFHFAVVVERIPVTKRLEKEKRKTNKQKNRSNGSNLWMKKEPARKK